MSFVLTFRRKKIDRLRTRTLNKLETFSRIVNAQGPQPAFARFSKIVDSFFSRRFRLKRAFTYHDLENEIKERGDMNRFKKKIELFIKELSSIKYGKKKVTKQKISELLKNFKEIIEVISTKDKVYFKKVPLLDYIIEKYLDIYDSFVKKIKSFFPINKKEKKR